MNKEFELKLDKIIERIDSPEMEERLKKLFEIKEKAKQLIDEYSILNCLGINLLTYNKLQQSLSSPKLSESEAEKISYIISKIKSFANVNKILNDHNIKNGARISKNAMMYLLKQDEEQQDLVIINVNLIGDDPLSIEKLTKNENK